MGLAFSNHFGCESRVVGEPTVGYGVVKGFDWRGSESDRCVEN